VNVRRTPAGISNEHLFHNSEAVVYVEGGESSRTAIPDASTDVLFWRGLFDVFVVGRRFHFKPRCGKQTLLILADGIADGTITAVVVCMDRDHDHLRGLRRTSRVLYTRGYSWENDVWSVDVVEEAFYMLCGVDRNAVKVRTSVNGALAQFASRMRWPVYADVLAALRADSVIPRDNLKCVIPAGRGWPSIDSGFLFDCVRRARVRAAGATLRLPEEISVELWRDVYGHVLGYFCYRMLADLLKHHCGQNITRDFANAVAIRVNRELMRPDVLRHHQDQFAKLNDRQ
jgi:hypothetical protein